MHTSKRKEYIYCWRSLADRQTYCPYVRTAIGIFVSNEKRLAKKKLQYQKLSYYVGTINNVSVHGKPTLALGIEQVQTTELGRQRRVYWSQFVVYVQVRKSSTESSLCPSKYRAWNLFLF